jgi:hypothetical protein
MHTAVEAAHSATTGLAAWEVAESYHKRLSPFPFHIFRRGQDSFEQGCQIFLVKHTKAGKIIPKGHKVYQMALRYSEWP